MIPQQEYVEHRVQGCLFRLLPGVPVPKIRYTRKPSSGLTLREERALHRNRAIKQYLIWKYGAKNKTLAKNLLYADIRIIKDEETKLPRQIKVIYDRKYKTRYQAASHKELVFDIPQWDYDPIAEEVTE